MTFGLLSDIHYTNKPYRLRAALRSLGPCEAVLIAGDITENGTGRQFSDVLRVLGEELPGTAVFTVSGNHDMGSGIADYREFENEALRRFSAGSDIRRSETGAYCVRIGEEADILGLNPLYHQKLFRFPEHGEQLGFLETCLRESTAARHIILCHAPLIAHNPQRAADRQPYYQKEQEARLREILHAHRNIYFLSGHTHFVPTVERDEPRNTVYINDGSIHPTKAGPNGETRHGNVFRLSTRGLAERVEL